MEKACRPASRPAHGHRVTPPHTHSAAPHRGLESVCRCRLPVVLPAKGPRSAAPDRIRQGANELPPSCIQWPLPACGVSTQQARVTSGQPAASRPQQQQRQLWSALRRVRGRRLQPLAPRRACAIGGYVCAVAAGRVAASRHDQLHPGHDVAATRPLRHGLRDGARPWPSHRMVCPTHYDAYSLRCTHCALTCVMVLNLRPRGDT